ncbi:MAG: hypothetical protein AB7D39_17645 [Pseudodesulfovibrio sp.]|uniref:hypothetical protein n=1 Tax=Pseudodesulfovibrio sp. TaxID=2035812 RepID=UPI003D113CE6
MSATGPKNLDWGAIRHAYVYENPRPSYATLSKRFDVGRETVARRGREEGWVNARKAAQDRVHEQAAVCAEESIIDRLKAVNVRIFDQALRLLDVTSDWIDEIRTGDRRNAKKVAETLGVIQGVVDRAAKGANGDDDSQLRELIDGLTSLKKTWKEEKEGMED